MAVCTGLTALAFNQEPGRIVPDTKLDLSVDPVGMLTRALHLWEPLGFFGQVQNQAYGYLFPMGPFFAVGHAVALPEWVVQRLWLAFLLCAAFMGMVRVTAALQIGTPHIHLIAGLAYALSPRMMTTLGSVSIEALPMAMAPWVLLPLIHGTNGGSPRRAAAWSGLAVFAIGGVNATATLAALPPAALWLLTRQPGPRRRALIAWWSLSVVLATTWWVAPLLVLGAVSPPFLDYIETAAVTTANTTLVEVLRGTSHWVAYLADVEGPLWRAGWELVRDPVLVVDTAIVAALGIAGLLLRGVPERRWLVLTALTGLSLLTFGHVGSLDGGFAEAQRDLLDASLAPMRNVHKFDPVLRLPLVLGVAYLLARLSARYDSVALRPALRLERMVALVVVAAVVGGASPALAGSLAPRGSYEELPGYWEDSAAWLRANAEGRALLVPASSFGEYYWGRPRDLPLQALGDVSWGARDAVPLAPAGNIRALDAVKRQLASGRGSPGLADYLARMGVSHLVVSNDLDYAAQEAPRPTLVHQALADSPGIRRVAAFGPPVGGRSRPDVAVDQGLDLPYHAVEIYDLQPDSEVVTAAPVSSALTVSGGPESLLTLSDRGWVQDRPTIFAGDQPSWLATGGGVVTDTLRRREVHFGALYDNESATLAPEDPLTLDVPVHDYLPWDDPQHQTVARQIDATVTASSSGSEPRRYGGADQARQPFAGVDGDPGTAWWSAGGGAVGEWLELRFDSPRAVDEVTLRLDADAPGPDVTRVTVETERGSTSVTADPLGRAQTVDLPAGSTAWVRVTADAVTDGGVGAVFGVSELTVPDLTPERTLITPRDLGAAQSPSAVALDVSEGERGGCVWVGSRPLCADGLARQGEDLGVMDRTVWLPSGGRYQVEATATPRAGEALDELLAPGGRRSRATASSQAVEEPVSGAQAALDRDLGTGWVADADDQNPTLRVTLPERRRITGVQVLLDDALGASRPESVRVVADDEVRQADVDEEGYARFEALETDRLEVSFPQVVPRASLDPYQRTLDRLPVGLSELRVLGADDLRRTETDPGRVRVPCGEGPPLKIGDRTYETSFTADRDQLRKRQRVPLEVCGADQVAIQEGETRIRATGNALASVSSVSLIPEDFTAEPAESMDAQPIRWDTEHRSVRLGDRSESTLLTVRENTNPGWEARLGDRTLPAVTVDGWQQGWVVPAGKAATVELVYQPGRWYRLALGVGALNIVALLLLALWRSRRAGPPGIQPGRGGVGTVAGLAGLLYLVGGAVALGIAGVASIARFLIRPRWLLAVVAAAMMVAAGLLQAAPLWDPDIGGQAAAAQALSIGAVATAAGAALPKLRRRRGTRRLRRSRGSSSHV